MVDTEDIAELSDSINHLHVWLCLQECDLLDVWAIWTPANNIEGFSDTIQSDAFKRSLAAVHKGIVVYKFTFLWAILRTVVLH